jgi:hypothetical protein
MEENNLSNTTTEIKEKIIVNRLSRKDRIVELKLQIKETGLWNMPCQRELAKKYGVTQQMINKDIASIVATFDPNELNEIFSEFFNVDKKAMTELRYIINTGTKDEKMKAIDTLLRLQKGMTELLEAYAKKSKVPDKIDIRSRNYTITIHQPEINEIIVGKQIQENKVDEEQGTENE